MNGLAEWLSDQIGSGKRFRTARELSLAAGLNQNTVAHLLKTGRVEPRTLIQLAVVTGEPVRNLFILAGWLPPDEALIGLVDKIERLSPEERTAIEAVVDAFLLKR